MVRRFSFPPVSISFRIRRDSRAHVRSALLICKFLTAASAVCAFPPREENDRLIPR